MTERQALRQQLRLARHAFDAHEHAWRSAAITRQLVNHRLFRAAQHIACYLSNDAEVDLTSLMDCAWTMGKIVYLPVVSASHHNRLHFLPYAPGDTLVANGFGIPEPVPHSRQSTALTRLDLVLAPLVGFDVWGNRLGMGGGFYDRTFAFLRRRQYWRKPHLWGVAFDAQRSPTELPHQHWDVPLEGVVTESGVQQRCRPKNP
ncbi:MAG: 5-formyltetrahydrofolate cyclo-ligase [Gammaproteobacteria bacterium]|nr:5-formyltetrahydrofolate cyclo-ligase [Gammaproteobacteria bacterium]MCF6261269.1 5-formyltetrahydrofolate cyclo-ligase [Gammaproteobacteria bacterium]